MSSSDILASPGGCVRLAPPAACPFLLSTILLFSSPSAPGETGSSPGEGRIRDLLDLSIEDLLSIEVITATRRPEPLSDLPAAIHVITRDDIRRSGATTLPDLLRLAPGVQVAQVHAHQWAVSSRGFNDVFANKLLVMIDGRSIYSPLFSGVFWDSHHPLLHDIDQIEVIRGPGASLWGVNAVNGVINIRTRHARETQGTVVSGLAGNSDRFIGSIRHGGQLRENQFFRVYLQHREHADFPSEFPGADDSWDFTQGGFRSDQDLSDVSVFTFQGDLYRGRLEETYMRTAEDPPHDPFLGSRPIQLRGGNLLGRITRSLDSEADVVVQAYYEMSRRDTLLLDEERQTVDIDFQHRVPLWERHFLTWGAGYRLTADRTEDSFDIVVDPDSRTLQHFSFFANDQIELLPDRLVWAIGAKVEHTKFTGFELQPDTSLTWKPRPRHTIWGKVARAVRTPSRAEQDFRLNQTTPEAPVLTALLGSRDFQSEVLLAYEIGYRVQPADDVAVDVAVFYHDYDRLRSFEPEDFRLEPAPPHLPFFAANELQGETYGTEIATTWSATDFWRLYGSYSLLRMHLRSREGSGDTTSAQFIEGSNPKHQWLVRSSLDMANDWNWDTWFRFVDSLPARNVDSYLEMDMRLAWRPGDQLELALVGRNLLRRRHEEFTQSRFVQTQQSQIPRSFYAHITWQF